LILVFWGLGLFCAKVPHRHMGIRAWMGGKVGWIGDWGRREWVGESREQVDEGRV